MPAVDPQDFGEVKGTVDTLKTIGIWILGFLGVLIGSAGALYVQFGDVKTDVAVIKRDVATITDRLTKLEKQVADIQSGQVSAATILSRVEAKLQQPPPQPRPAPPMLALTSEEGMIIRDLLKSDFVPAIAYKTGARIGDEIPVASLRDFSDTLLSKVPKLKGTKYAFDEKGQILIASASDNRVVAII